MQVTSLLYKLGLKKGFSERMRAESLFATGQMPITKSTSPLCPKQLFRKHHTPALLRVTFKTEIHLHLHSYSQQASLPAAINIHIEIWTEGKDSRPCSSPEC